MLAFRESAQRKVVPMEFRDDDQMRTYLDTISLFLEIVGDARAARRSMTESRVPKALQERILAQAAKPT